MRKLYPYEPTGNLARHLNMLAYLISGIVRARHVNLRRVAGQMPDSTKKESRIKRFARWLDNERLEADVYFAFHRRFAGQCESGAVGEVLL